MSERSADELSWSEDMYAEFSAQYRAKGRGGGAGSQRRHSAAAAPNRGVLLQNGVKATANGDVCPRGPPKKPASQRLTYLCDGKQYVDTLHTKISEPIECNKERCMHALMEPPKENPRAPGEPRALEDVRREAMDLVDQFYASINKSGSSQHKARTKEVLTHLDTTGTYNLTKPELSFGVKTAWRNASRCIGRIQWSRLQLFDARHIQTASGMFDAICDHIRFGTNKGNIRSVITVFPHRTDGKSDFRVWNTQLISYAGYKQQDGSVIGDPANVEFTQICEEKMGWKGEGGMFDILPLVLQAGGKDPEMFILPPDIILEVNLKHPKYPWFEELGYKWYALPAVSCLILDVGGLEFTGIPFNGWYMCTEIGTRDLCDPQRYNITEKVAKGMGLNTSSNVSLWKDHAVTAVNEAVLHSFNSSRVTITDHHSASASFMKHAENEYRLRGGIPGDWVWIVPPVTGSLCPVFHLEMINYKLKPSYEYQPAAWKHHVWKEKKEVSGSGQKVLKRKITFKDLAKAVRLTASMMGDALVNRIACTILYATETGRSETFANNLSHTFSAAFNPKVKSMEDFDAHELEHESLVFFVTSTFGNGDPPENGVEFAKGLHELKGILDNNKSVDLGDDADTAHVLGNVRFSVFGLGSSAYPNFCAFAEFLDGMLSDLGGERIHALSKGDELGGQEESFQIWSTGVYKRACEVFMITDNLTNKVKQPPDNTWMLGKYRLTKVKENKMMKDNCAGLSAFNQRKCFPCKMIEVINLQNEKSDRQTMLVKLDTGGIKEMEYLPGDHVGILPENRKELVDLILSRLTEGSAPDDIVQLETSKETTGIFGTKKDWDSYKLPPCTLRQALTLYLDITTPATPAFLAQLIRLAPDDEDLDKINTMVKNPASHDDWRLERWPGIAQILQQFPSLMLPPTFLMTQLPALKQRFYSISSSLQVHPNEIHLTVALVHFNTKDHEPRFGVCSTWLHGLKKGGEVPAFIRSAKDFHMPKEVSRPILMVGPGTGIAPFRSFWQQRNLEMGQNKNKKLYGEMHLFFGCRNSTMDNIHTAEREIMLTKGALTTNRTALSREPDLPKVYVQDLLTENGSEIHRLLTKEHGHLYICGDVSMATDVKATVVSILRNLGDMSKEEADRFMVSLKASARYHEDIFGVTLKTKEVTNKARQMSKQKSVMSQSSNC